MILRLWTTLLFTLLCATAIAWFIALMHEKNLRPVRELAAFFKRHPVPGRVILGMFFIGMCVYGSTKSGNGGGGGDGGGTNSLQMVVGSGDGLQPLDSPETVALDDGEKVNASPVPMRVRTKPRRKSSPSRVRLVFGEVMGVKSVHSSATVSGESSG